jgi:hypothetical protein
MSDPSKKRKRNADGSKKPSKKVAVETPPNVTISLVEDADEWAPIVGKLDPKIPSDCSASSKFNSDTNSMQLLLQASLSTGPSP